MTPIIPTPPSWRADVAEALATVGKEDPNKPATVRAARTARVLLETVPISALIDALPPLWAQEETKRRRKAARPLYVVLPLATVVIVYSILGLCGVGPEWSHHISPALTGINAINFLFRSLGTLTPLQKGILRTLHLRPHPALVPLLIDTFGGVTLTGSPVTLKEHRALLTHLLPLWCENDTPDLTPQQRRLLLSALSSALGRGNILTRPLGEPPAAIPLEDADFAQCALTTLRRSRTSPQDKRALTRTRRILEHIPAPTFADDPRYEVLITAAEYATLLHR